MPAKEALAKSQIGLSVSGRANLWHSHESLSNLPKFMGTRSAHKHSGQGFGLAAVALKYLYLESSPAISRR
jgi:hypothetical protein